MALINASRRDPTVRHAFTLIELLVVIAIISLLAAILFPVFARARENARRSSCQSNLKQLALGVRQYIDDNDGRSLAAHGIGASASYSTSAEVWPPIEPYLKSDQLVFCPSAAKFKDPFAPGNAWRGYHYGFPDNWTCATTYLSISSAAGKNPSFALPLVDQIPEPARTCMLGEVEGSSNYGPGTSSGWAGQIITVSSLVSGFVFINRDRHLEGSNFAYLDGHVKWIKQENITKVVAQQNVGGTGQGITTANASDYPIVFAWKN
jgi:prepilin-type N-terminal cleavage/methylation domain-containing protein/prepilin-type processing-associated H-X9-DG protein